MMRRIAFLVYALLSAGAVQAQTIELQTLEGVLHVVWGDPQETALGSLTGASPHYRAFITTDAGESVEVEPLLGRDLTAGDLVALNGRRVRASGASPALRAAPSGSNAAFQALSITPAASLGAAAFNAAPNWPINQRPYAIILCKFNDVPDEPLPVSRYEAMYANSVGGADDFYREVSDGRINIQGTRIYGWYTLPRARSSYLINDQANLGQLFNDCTRQADPDVDFRQVVGMAMHFNAFLDCCSWGGSRTAMLDGVTKTFATMWNASWARSGTSWHEMGHSVGLPHSGGPYGRTYDSVWDVMSASTSGRYLNSDFGFGGAHFIGYHKNLLGLIPAGRRVTVTSGEWRGVIEQHARNTNGTGTVLVMVPVADRWRLGQQYTLELRGKTGYDVRLPRAALIIHSVVPGRAEPAQIVDGDGDGDPNDDGVTWTVGETFSDPAAGIEILIDSLTASGVAVTVRNGVGRGATLAKGGATLPRAYGEATLARDSVRVTGVTTWRTSQRRSWLSLVRGTGSEGEYLTYEIDVRTLAPGRYADTLRVYSASGTSIAAPYVVEVVIAPATDVAALSVIARRDSARTGVTSNVDSTFLSLQGRYATSSWSAVRSSDRLFIGSRLANGSLVIDLSTSEINGVGSGWVYFRRGPESSAGRTVDTLAVTIADATPITLRMVDTLDAFAPIAARITRSGGQHRALQGALGAIDSMSISFDDPRSATLEWYAVNQYFGLNRLRNTRGLGGHTLRWAVDGSTVAIPGTQIDTIFVCTTLSATCVTYVDTLTIEPSPSEMRLSAAGGRSAVVRGTRQRSESLYVQMLGANGRTRPWSASSSTTRIAFHALDAFTANGAGTGSKYLRWSRATNDLAPGTYVDTVTVHADGIAGAPARYIDTLVVTAGAAIVGDVDGDGSITTGDALIILRSLVALPIVASAVVANGDANCDGQVTAADAQLILQLDVGIPPQGSCLGRPRTPDASR